MRRMAFMTGVIALLAVAALTLNTVSAAPRGVQGSIVSLVAATKTIATADRDRMALVARATTATTSEPAEKSDLEAKPAAPRVVVTAGCQQAINNLKALHLADVTEDAAERASQPQTLATALADRAEDAAELQKWLTALTAARAVCLPQPNAACQAEIASLEAVLLTTRTDELAELQGANPSDWAADWMSVRTAFSAVATACAGRE